MQGSPWLATSECRGQHRRKNKPSSSHCPAPRRARCWMHSSGESTITGEGSEAGERTNRMPWLQPDRAWAMHKNMKPRMLNKICAHAEIVACVLGACALDAVMIRWLMDEAPLRAIVADWHTMLYLLAALIPATLLGSLFGMLTFWPLVRVVCSKINGAPLKPGDQVMVLTGPHRGAVAEVYGITRGQGGWELARLDLGIEERESFRDIYEEYSLLRIKRSEPSPTQVS